jgi:hypothetical protein
MSKRAREKLLPRLCRRAPVGGEANPSQPLRLQRRKQPGSSVEQAGDNVAEVLHLLGRFFVLGLELFVPARIRRTSREKGEEEGEGKGRGSQDTAEHS